MVETNLERLQLLEEFYSEIRKLVRNLGRTNFINKHEVESLLEEYNRGIKCN